MLDQSINAAKITKLSQIDYEWLIQIALKLNLSNSIDYIYELIVYQSAKLLNADRVSLFLIDTDSNEVYTHLAMGLEGKEIRLPMGRGVAGTVAFNGQPINITDAELDPRPVRNYFGYVTKNILAVPLKLKGSTIVGVVQALNKAEGPFDERDERVLEILCSLAGVALERANSIHEKEALDEKMIYQAQHDLETGLPNRALLLQRLSLDLEEAKRRQQELAVLMIDLDRFKLINDSLGHVVGDELLKQVAHRIKTSVRMNDLVTRLGGDEFVIVLSKIKSRQDVGKVAQNLLKAIQRPFYVEGTELFVTGSIGISMYPNLGKSVTELIRQADNAMYRVKAQGKNNYQFFAEEMSDIELRRLSLVTQLHKALEYEELMPFYQPQLNLQTGKLVGMEALLRWKHRELGMISPAEFIPLAEETGLVVPIGTWVLNDACKQTKKWQLAGYPPIRMSVNVSAVQFNRNDFIGIVREALQTSQLDPQYLELELTEGLLLQDIQGAAAKLKELKKLGVYIAIDDFGTGYSSLRYLKQLPIDTLKIDQSFIRDMRIYDPAKVKDKALVEAIIMLGHNLGMNIIAEGVELQEHVDFLRNSKCEEIQGYIYCKPIPALEIETFMAQGGPGERLSATLLHNQPGMPGLIEKAG
jgi:diguanylate cyclase (GGDEF)-like protein